MAVFLNQPGDNLFQGTDGVYDQVDYAGNLTDYTFVRLSNGNITVSHPTLGTDTLSSIEGFWFYGEQNWYSLEQALELAGPSPNTATDGNDQLFGTDGDDVINALDGNDTIFSSLGADMIDGGAGRDTLSYASADQAIDIDGFGNGYAGAQGDSIQNIETLIGSTFDDIIDSSGAINRVEGGDGNDVLIASAGDSDFVIFEGGEGDDTFISGDANNETFFGQGGADNFIITPGSGRVTIRQFDSDNGDRINLDAFGFDNFGDLNIIITRGGTTLDLGNGDIIIFDQFGGTLTPEAFGLPPSPTGDIANDASTTAVIEGDGGSLLSAIEIGGDVDWIAINAQPGDILQFNTIDTTTSVALSIVDSNGNTLASSGVAGPTGAPSQGPVFFSVPDDGEYFVAVRNFGFRTEPMPGEYTLVSESSRDDFGNDFAAATSLSVGETIAGVINLPDDQDVFTVDVIAGQTVLIDMTATGDSVLTPLLRIFDGNGNEIDVIANGSIEVTASQTGQIFVVTDTVDSSPFSQLDQFGDYSLSVTEVASEPFLFGTDGDDTLVGSDINNVFSPGSGNDTIDGNGGDYNQVDYDGALADYTITQNDNGTVTVAHPTLGTDTLTDIDGFWFGGEGQWYSLADALANSGGPVDQPFQEGTDGNDVLVGSNINNVFFGGAGDDIIDGNGGDYNQADYDGSINDYAIFDNGDGTYTVNHANGTDTLTDIDGFWFGGDAQWYSLQGAIDTTANDFLV